MIPAPSAPNVAVIGGSLGGLMTALALRSVGCSVDVFERVPQRLEGQGAGLRIVPELGRLLQDRVGIHLGDVSTFVTKFRTLGAGDRVLSEEGSLAQFTSWGSLHGALVRQFGSERYHLGKSCTGLRHLPDGVELEFATGEVRRVDLAVFADGILSTGRRLLSPQAELDYAGYIAWRGFVPEAAVSVATRQVLGDSVTYCVLDHSHLGIYPIPHPAHRDPDTRYFNFVWYRLAPPGAPLDRVMTDRTGVLRSVTLPAGSLSDAHVEELRSTARECLPPAAAEMIVKTEMPFLQAIYDLAVHRMVYGRACLIGDAAFVARPHAGAAMGKASFNAWRLADCLDRCSGDVEAALAQWEPQELAFGNEFVERNRVIGNKSLHENRYDPLDPAFRPGLFPQGAVNAGV